VFGACKKLRSERFFQLGQGIVLLQRRSKGGTPMKKLILLALAVVGTAVIAAAPSTARNSPTKTWICHKVDSNKWVAIRVPAQRAKGHLRHGDQAVPAGMQSRAAAKAYCASLPLVTPTRGGRKLEAELKPSGGNTLGSGEVTVRAKPFQQRVCWLLRVNLSATQLGTTGLVTAAHIHGPLPSTAIFVGFTLSPTTLATLNASLAARGRATVSGCETNVDRAKIDQLLRTPRDFYVNVHTTSFPAGAIQGTLSR
jgi:CHRD domain